MNYILIHFGAIPKHLRFCVENIKNVDNKSNIILATDQMTVEGMEHVKHVNLEKIETPHLAELSKLINNLNYFENENNKLWEASLKRVFGILDVAVKLDIDNFIHFDNDVLIYKSFAELENEFSKEKINITQLSDLFLNFSYSYFPNIKLLEDLTNEIIKIFKNVNFYEEKYYEGKRLNEMVILNIIFQENPKFFNILNSIPSTKNTIIFDSASFGQYLSGFHKKKKSRKKRLEEMRDTQHLGKHMYENKYRPEFIKSYPVVRFENKTIEIANLHIHSKKLKKYLIK